MSDKLNQMFDLAVEVIHPDESVTIIPAEGDEVEVDFNFVRVNHYKLAMHADEAMDLAMKVARESEQPRAIETLSMLLKTASEVNRQLLVLSKDRAEAKSAKLGKGVAAPAGTQINANNVVFTGNSADLNKMLKGA